MLMLVLIDKQENENVSGAHIEWCNVCNLDEASKRARETEQVNGNRISVAVVDEQYDSYAFGKYYKNLKRLDMQS